MKPTKPSSAPATGRPVSRARSAHGRRKFKESNTLMQCRNGSIFNATRDQQREDDKLLRTQRKLDKQSNIFANEVKKLRDRQCKLASTHKRMCTTALKKYSVYLIQALYRGHHDRQLCRRLRSERLLGYYFPRRFRFRKRARASRMIIQAYRRFVFFRAIQHYHILFQNAKKIQRCYRSYYALRRAIIRRFSMITWKHVALFGVCRATQVVYPHAKHKRIIYRAFVNFYARLRRRRLEIHFNSYRLFYGLFFAELPTAKRHIQSRASSIVNRKSRTFERSRESILRNIDIEVGNLKIARAPQNVLKRRDEAATHDILAHLRGHVIADQMKQMRAMNKRKPSVVATPSTPNSNNLPFPRSQSLLRAIGTLRRGSSLAEPPPSSSPSIRKPSVKDSPESSPPSTSPKTFLRKSSTLSPPSQRKDSAIHPPPSPHRNSQTIAMDAPPAPRLSSVVSMPERQLPGAPRASQHRKGTTAMKHSITAFNALGPITEGQRVKAKDTPMPKALPTFDEVFNDYVMPKRLMKYRSTSQIDSNSMFANLKVDGSDKLVPFELRGNYRLKTIYDVVQCLKDLSAIALKNPLVLQNPFDRKILPENMIKRETKPDRSPRFIETFLPFNGTFQHSIFRRGSFSYDFESSVVYNQLNDLTFSAGKRALLRQHVLKSSAVFYEEERYKRRHFLNPMRKDQPMPPEFDIETLDAQFLENFESSDSNNIKKTKKMKKKKRIKKHKTTHIEGGKTLTLQEQENIIRGKILKMREDILQQQEIIKALNDGSDEESDSDTSSTSSTSGSSGDSKSGTEGSSSDESDEEETGPNSNAVTTPDPDITTPSLSARPPITSMPSFQRRRNVSLTLL